MEELAVLDVVAVDELLVGEDVAVGVEDALREPGRAGGVVELGRVVGGGVDGLEAPSAPASSSSSSTITCSTRSASHALGVVRVVTISFAWSR